MIQSSTYSAARNGSSRRSYVDLSFFSFLSPRNLRAASAYRRETLPRDRKKLFRSKT